jgi:hypothetical protein
MLCRRRTVFGASPTGRDGYMDLQTGRFLFLSTHPGTLVTHGCRLAA